MLLKKKELQKELGLSQVIVLLRSLRAEKRELVPYHVRYLKYTRKERLSEHYCCLTNLYIYLFIFGTKDVVCKYYSPVPFNY